MTARRGQGTDGGARVRVETVGEPARDSGGPEAGTITCRIADLRSRDVELAGGKGANLGELMALEMPVPEGFVVCAPAWVLAREESGLGSELAAALAGLDPRDDANLRERCTRAVDLVRRAPIPEAVTEEVRRALDQLGAGPSTPLIVRSSATMEDSAAASFAGMNETFANVLGTESVLRAISSCWASLYSPRSVSYRADRGLDVADAGIAVVVQRFVPALRSGVMFTLDPTNPAGDGLVIEASVGGGLTIVAGRVTPDRFVVDRVTMNLRSRELRAKRVREVSTPSGGTHEERVPVREQRAAAIDDGRVTAIARIGMRIEQHFGSAQDVEWVIDPDQKLWIVQSRPVTARVAAQVPRRRPAHDVLVRGVGASPGSAIGRVRTLHDPKAAAALQRGEVLVAAMTSPDWAPAMRRAAAIVTDAGGMTCHAAIVARELGIPCVVGAGNAMSTLHDGELVTVDGARGRVLAGEVPIVPAAATATRLGEPAAAPAARARAQVTGTEVLANLSDPAQVERVASMPCDGVGLLRSEVMIVDALSGVHPLELIARGDQETFIQHMHEHVSRFCAAFAPRPVTYRTIDFRTNEFRGLTGGERFEPVEANPMIGMRGAGRYAAQPELLGLEAAALGMVRRDGHANLRIILPFVRTPGDVAGCLPVLEQEGLLGDRGCELWIMAEVPSVLWQLERYRSMGVAGISIGSNDLTQLLLGVDRDSGMVRGYEATDPAVQAYVVDLLARASACELATSICGQAPALHPGYVDLLVEAGIGSISVTPDALDTTRAAVARAEQRILLRAARS